MDIHFAFFKKGRVIWSFMKFLNINQFMNTNMWEKMLKNISNTLCKHNLSEIVCKTENRPDDIYVRTHFKGSESQMQLENAYASKEWQMNLSLIFAYRMMFIFHTYKLWSFMHRLICVYISHVLHDTIFLFLIRIFSYWSFEQDHIWNVTSKALTHAWNSQCS